MSQPTAMSQLTALSRSTAISRSTAKCSDGKWTTTLERHFLSTWSREDDNLLNASMSTEETLWAACHAIYGLTPPEILPAEIQVDTGMNMPISIENGGQLVNNNWSKAVCTELSKLIKRPAFCEDLPFLRYVLRYTLFLRLGRLAGFEEPTTPDCSKDLAEEIIRNLAQKVQDPEAHKQLTEGIPKIKLQLEARYGRGDHPHIGIVEALKGIVKTKYHPNSTGLIFKDIQWILQAWKVHAVEKGLPLKVTNRLHRTGQLPSEAKRREDAIRIRDFDFRGTKKSYILSVRRMAAESEGGWRRSGKDLFGEAVEVGKEYPFSDSDKGDDEDNAGHVGQDDGSDQSGGSYQSDGSDHLHGSDQYPGSVHVDSDRDVHSPGCEADLPDVLNKVTADPVTIATLKRPMETPSSPQSGTSCQRDGSSCQRDGSSCQRDEMNKRHCPDLIPARGEECVARQNPEPKGLASSNAQSTGTHIEEVRKVWKELAPDFSLQPWPVERPALRLYLQSMMSTNEQLMSGKCKGIWATTSNEARAIIFEHLNASIDHFDDLNAGHRDDMYKEIINELLDLLRYFNRATDKAAADKTAADKKADSR